MHVLEAKISDYLVIARKHGEIWYLAGITDETKRDFTVDLSFLDASAAYTLEWVEDGVNSDKIAIDYTKGERKAVTSKDKIDLNLHTGGGWIGVLTKTE